MNIDGLHRALPALAPLWSPTRPEGVTLEMHGCARDAVCEACGAVSPLTPLLIRAFRAAPAQPARAPRCAASACAGALRPRVMLYDDPSEALITPSFDAALAADLAGADVILWVGISFEQSASVEHFRRVRRALQAAGRAGEVPHVVVNPRAHDAAFNVATAVANAHELRLLRARAGADAFLGALAGLPQAAGGGAGGAAAAGVTRGPRRKRKRRQGGAAAAAVDCAAAD
jgi:NAD-dependent SIR2 family protein deacetylase